MSESDCGKPIIIALLNAIMHLAFSLFSRHISRMQSLKKIAVFLVLVALKPLVSLTWCVVFCSARIAVDKKHTKHCNPRCACEPRVNILAVLI